MKKLHLRIILMIILLTGNIMASDLPHIKVESIKNQSELKNIQLQVFDNTFEDVYYGLANVLLDCHASSIKGDIKTGFLETVGTIWLFEDKKKALGRVIKAQATVTKTDQGIKTDLKLFNIKRTSKKGTLLNSSNSKSKPLMIKDYYELIYSKLKNELKKAK